MSLYWIENTHAYRIAIAARPRGGDWLGDELRRLQNAGVQILVSMLTQSEIQELGLALESEECQALGLEYMNFAIEDRGTPERALEFKGFVSGVVAKLREGKSVAVHCRAGIGRSSLLACSVLVRSGIECSQAWSLVEKARGCPVPDTNQQNIFVEALIES